MTNPLETTDTPLVQKLGHTLDRITVAMRADQWGEFGLSGLNPTQSKILILLGRRSALRLGEIASEMAVSAPTISESIGTLVEKGMVKKEKAKDDGRAISIHLTTAGKRLVQSLDVTAGAIGQAISQLPEIDQVQLYSTLIRLIRELQVAGRIPISRMCVTCRYFRPRVRDDAERPHHCALVDASFGDKTIRSDCPEHEAADEHLAQQNWSIFSN